MSDLESNQETIEEIEQPADVVTTEAEESSTSQDGNDDIEFVVDDAGDQEKTPEDNEELKRRAAFKRSKEKERKAKALQQEEKERADRLESELLELRAQVSDIRRGERPDINDFVDSNEFYAALDEWNGKNSEKKEAPSNPAPKDFERDIEVEYTVHQSSEKLKRGGISDFDEKLKSLHEDISIIDSSVDTKVVVDSLSKIAIDADVDPAKAIYMIAGNQFVLNEINEVGSNPIKVAKILKREASKLKERKKNPIDTAPEPDIGSGRVKKTTDLSTFGHFD